MVDNTYNPSPMNEVTDYWNSLISQLIYLTSSRTLRKTCLQKQDREFLRNDIEVDL